MHLGVENMDIEKLQILVKLGLIEALQSYLEDDEELNTYYYREDEDVEDDFFKDNLEED